MPDLPAEIVDRVLDYLHDDPQTLAACALAARVMLPTSRFHRFGELVLNTRRIQTLEPLLDAAQDLARVVTSVRLYVSPMTLRGRMALLSRLPSLSSLGISTSTPYTDHSFIQNVSLVHAYVPCLTSLYLLGPQEAGSLELISTLSSFKALKEIALWGILLKPGEVPEESLQNVAPPLGLRCLKFRGSECASLIGRWLNAHASHVRLQSLHFNIRHHLDAEHFNTLSALLSDNVKDVQIDFLPYGRMDIAMGGREFSLSVFGALEHCVLRFAFGEMCVAENPSLPWISEIVAQLSSPRLRRISLSLVVDNVEDLRSLNSECAVRDLSPAYFKDMRVLDWESIEKSLTGENLRALREFVLEGRGSRDLLEKHLESTCPELHSRALVSFVTVSKDVSWL
ncbi:hypothetical protein BD414DRAFT_503012 [Trametes punicea]|nr:hypothetical protein BD414DRAFT_503012 [Trametes punicea]